MLPDNPPAIEIAGPAQVADGDTLRVDNQRIRLIGVDAPELHQTCLRGSMRVQCGLLSRRWLAARIGHEAVKCRSESEDRYGRRLATCTLRGRDLNADLVAAGWAVAYREYSSTYVPQENHARAARRGLWALQFEMPSEARRQARAAAQNDSPPDPACAIKGNVNGKGARIFHLPGSHAYPEVRINVAAGERWFCSIAEATAAGWRAPR